MYLEQVNIKPRESRPESPAVSLPRYSDYFSGYQGDYPGTLGYEPEYTAEDFEALAKLEDQPLKLMSLQGVRTVIEAARTITDEVFDVQADNADWADALGEHARTIIMSNSLTAAGVAHYIYTARQMHSGIAVASSDYPDGTQNKGFVLYSSGQWKGAPHGESLRQYLVGDTTDRIDRSLHQETPDGQGNVAIFTVDRKAFLDGAAPDLTDAAVQDNRTVMRLYTADLGVRSLLDLTPDAGVRTADVQQYLQPKPVQAAAFA